jgi:hypothetical protein
MRQLDASRSLMTSAIYVINDTARDGQSNGAPLRSPLPRYHVRMAMVRDRHSRKLVHPVELAF